MSEKATYFLNGILFYCYCDLEAIPIIHFTSSSLLNPFLLSYERKSDKVGVLMF